MTCICNFATKKALITSVEEGNVPMITDPSVISPYSGPINRHPALLKGEMITVTNHPKRSYFANVIIEDGKVKVS